MVGDAIRGFHDRDRRLDKLLVVELLERSQILLQHVHGFGHSGWIG